MMQFSYEISVDEYSAAQTLYYKACTKRQPFTAGLGWTFVGLLFLSIAVFGWVADWAHFLLLLTGGWFTYGGIAGLHVKRHYHKFYRAAGLAGKKYQVELDGDGFFVNGDGCNWRVQWPEVLFKGEDNRVFMFSAKGTLFIFGKKYVTGEQQEVIRQYAALS
jgi:hypothetical protein